MANCNTEILDAYRGWYYTILGAGGDLNEWKEGYQNMLNEQGIGTIEKWVEFTGEQVNRLFNMCGDDCFKPDLTILAFPLTGLNTGRLAMLKLALGDRWFTDVIDNSESAEIPVEDYAIAHNKAREVAE